MRIHSKIIYLLGLILVLNATEAFAQSTQTSKIISSGFGKNLATGCPRLQIIDDMLYAPGPNGIMRHGKGETATWEPFIMHGMNVVDFRISGDEIMAVIIPEDYSYITDMSLRSVTRLVKGKISGTNFTDITPTEMKNLYQGHIFTYLSAFAQHPTDSQTVMVMGHGGIFQSRDFGESWEQLTHLNATYNAHSFLGWHPQNPDVLFMTSESMIFVGMVCRSIDGGKNWEIFEPDPNSESSCHCIAFDPDNADHLLLSGEYKIYESFDCGKTWSMALNEINDNNCILGYATNIFYDSEDSSNSIVYAVGHENGWPPRHIVRSTDKGKTWQHCMTYDVNKDYNFFYDATLFDNKIWIYDADDIVYWEITGNAGITQTLLDSTSPVKYYDLNGFRLNSRPESGIVIESRGKTSKKIIL